MKRNKKVKNNGQIFTPPFMVSLMLDNCAYKYYNDILNKHIIDNSCGNGAFLIEIVERYCDAAATQDKNYRTAELFEKLKWYIHGIELNEELCNETKCRLDDYLSERYNEYVDIDWDIRCCDALSCDEYDEQMDFVIGNPPYVRVHNLQEQYTKVRNGKFSNKGMTDLYLSFFEKGFKMLKDGGTLCYITPSSWINNASGKAMRQYLKGNDDSVRLVEVIDNGNQKIFPDASTYTMVSKFCKDGKFEEKIKFKHYFMEYNIVTIDTERTYKESLIYNDERIFLDRDYLLERVRKLNNNKTGKYKVCNGYATLSDGVFFGNDIPDSNITIRVIKSSTGKDYKGIFPYNKDLKPLSETEIPENVMGYLLQHKEELSDEMRGKEQWYIYGRMQALKDTYKDKLAIGKLMDINGQIKITRAPAGVGVLSGLYVTTRDKNGPFTEEDAEYLISKFKSHEFIEYIRSLRKYESGGYYSFSGKDIEYFINQ